MPFLKLDLMEFYCSNCDFPITDHISIYRIGDNVGGQISECFSGNYTMCSTIWISKPPLPYPDKPNIITDYYGDEQQTMCKHFHKKQ